MSNNKTITGGIGLWDVQVYVHEYVHARPGLDEEVFTLKGADVENRDREHGRMIVRLRDGSVDQEHDMASLFWLELCLAKADFGQYSTTITGSLDEVRAYRDYGRISRERCTWEDCSESPAHDIIDYRPPALDLGKFRYVTLRLRPAKENS